MILMNEIVKHYDLNLNLKPIKQYVLNEKKSTGLKNQNSNVGGYQSFAYKEWPKVLFDLKNYIQKQIPDQTFISLWYNINGYDCYNKLHLHNVEKGYSGVFYIDVPDKDMGNLYFEDGTEYKPIPNRLILFPTDLKHGVKPNQSNQKRISMSFNYLKNPNREIKFQGHEFLKSGIKI